MLLFSARSAKGPIQAGAKVGRGGYPALRTSSPDQMATATNQILSRQKWPEGIREEVLLFLVRFRSQFLTHLWRLFSEPEPKAHVSYWDHSPSGVRRPSSVRPSVRKLFTFSTSSPKPLQGFQRNLTGSKYPRSLSSLFISAGSPQGWIRGGAT